MIQYIKKDVKVDRKNLTVNYALPKTNTEYKNFLTELYEQSQKEIE